MPSSVAGRRYGREVEKFREELAIYLLSASILRDFLNEDVVEKLIRHEV